jgi:hypothetical protein
VRSLVGSRFGRRFKSRRINTQQSLLLAETIARDNTTGNDGLTTVEFEPMEISPPAVRNNLEEPLLVLENTSMAGTLQDEGSEEFVENMSISSEQRTTGDADSKSARTIVALFVFWSAAALACSVQSIDVVWDLVGSSFSIMLAFLIPSTAYLKLAGRKRFCQEAQDGGMGFRRWMVSRAIAWGMILVFAPLMVISTLNACYNSFFSKDN